MSFFKKSLAVLVFAPAILNAATFDVFKSDSCGCCTKWVSELRSAGHEVREHHDYDIQMVKREAGVPANLASCHTAAVNGYFIEGHVPIADIERLLSERPSVQSLAVPGMPMPSPGMAAPGTVPQDFTVYSVSESDTAVFSAY